jgi:hypothetical protein
MRVVVDVPNWQAKLYGVPGKPGCLEKLLEGETEPGVRLIKVLHEKLCTEIISGGICNCDPEFRLEKVEVESDQ